MAAMDLLGPASYDRELCGPRQMPIGYVGLAHAREPTLARERRASHWEERQVKILAAVDRSEFADAVVAMVQRLARLERSAVLLLNVAPREPDVLGHQIMRKVITDPVPEELADRRALLDRLAARLTADDIPCETLLIRGKPAATVLQEARLWGAELIVMGSHGRSMLLRQFLGSVSEEILRARELPVLVVPPSADEPPSEP